jgi:probable rRNA maturation factor
MNQSPIMNELDQSAADADPLQGQEDQPPSSTNGQSEAKPSGLVVELFDSTKLVSESSQSEIIDLAKRALAAFPNQGEIRVRIVDDTQMSADHKQFSGIAGTTDVLTFDLSEPKDDFQSKVLDVDLTICFDEAQRQSTQLNHRIEHELLLYIIHGTLHCLGYNDHDQDEYQRMHEKEDCLLSTLGLPPTFFAPHDSPSEGAQS